MSQPESEKPCLEKAGQGFSVIYNKRPLYSKYKPESAPQRAVESLQIAEQTLVLVFSPLLGYALQELIEKTPENSFVLLVEADANLYDFSLPHIEKITAGAENVFYAKLEEASRGRRFLELFASGKAPPFSRFRRCLPVELSGGAKLYPQIYSEITALADNAINQFWRNRMTLVKLGRLYARNVLRNLAQIPFADALEAKSVEKPLLVCGSGPSLDLVAELVAQNRKFFHILAVDNALLPLLARGIRPDAVVAVESQLANEQAFIGAAQSGIALIADLTSRPHLLGATGGTVSLFLSEYEKCVYLERIRARVFPYPTVLPLGSVGLTAVELALFLRAGAQTPVFFCGLDFSFVPNKTHCREAASHRAALNANTRLRPLEDCSRTFTANSFFINGKGGKSAVTDPALSGYGKTFAMRFSGVENLFDASPEGMDTGCQKCSCRQMVEVARLLAQRRGDSESESRNGSAANEPSARNAEKRQTLYQNVVDFYQSEIAELEKLKDLLANGGKARQILPLIREREYLYLHFPDGYKEPEMNPSFLRRVRGEIDFFIKDMKLAQKCCVGNGKKR